MPRKLIASQRDPGYACDRCRIGQVACLGKPCQSCIDHGAECSRCHVQARRNVEHNYYSPLTFTFELGNDFKGKALLDLVTGYLSFNLEVPKKLREFLQIFQHKGFPGFDSTSYNETQKHSFGKSQLSLKFAQLTRISYLRYQFTAEFPWGDQYEKVEVKMCEEKGSSRLGFAKEVQTQHPTPSQQWFLDVLHSQIQDHSGCCVVFIALPNDKNSIDDDDNREIWSYPIVTVQK